MTCVCVFQGADINKEGKVQEAKKLGDAALTCDIVVIICTSALFACSVTISIVLILIYTNQISVDVL